MTDEAQINKNWHIEEDGQTAAARIENNATGFDAYTLICTVDGTGETVEQTFPAGELPEIIEMLQSNSIV